MIPLNMQHLENCFEEAMARNAEFVAVSIFMDGFPEEEVIINPIVNAEAKLDYYKRTYNHDLTHKFSSGIRITGFTFGEDFDDIEEDLIW